jgi:hypothetical protein
MPVSLSVPFLLYYLTVMRCPFCKTANYAVEYRGVKTKEEKGLEQIVRLDLHQLLSYYFGLIPLVLLLTELVLKVTYMI